jgi:hypothetical protein
MQRKSADEFSSMHGHEFNLPSLNACGSASLDGIQRTQLPAVKLASAHDVPPM